MLTEQILRDAIAWGRAYGDAIPASQWDEMRDAKVKQLVAQGTTLTDEHRDNFDVHVKELATKYALDRTAAGGWIFENHNLFTFVYAALSAYPTAAPVAAQDEPIDAANAFADLHIEYEKKMPGASKTTIATAIAIAHIERSAEMTAENGLLRKALDSMRALAAAKPVSVDAGGMTDRVAQIATVVKDVIESLMLWNGQASAVLDVNGLAGLRDEVAALAAPPTESTGEPTL